VREEHVRELMLATGGGDDRVLQLCTAAVGALAVDGVGLSMTNGPGQHRKVVATDEVSDRIEDLQVILGQGPCVDAVSTGAPVLVDDLAGRDVGTRWPMFTPAAAALGVRASFSVPLVVGSLRLGAMDLYRCQVGPLHPDRVVDALDYAGAAVNLLLEQQRALPADLLTETTEATEPTGWAASSSVYQATGMVMVQLGTDAEGAFAALRARAYQEGRSLAEVAADVLDRRVRMTDEEV
jgi:hypothetical protein